MPASPVTATTWGSPAGRSRTAVTSRRSSGPRPGERTRGHGGDRRRKRGRRRLAGGLAGAGVAPGSGASGCSSSRPASAVSGRRRGQAQLLAQQPAHLVVDAQRLGDVAARRVRLHQQRVRALAIRLAVDQLARAPLRRRQVLAAEPQRRPRAGLEQRGVRLDEIAAAILDPRRRHARQQRPARDLQAGGGDLERGARVAGGERRLGTPPRCRAPPPSRPTRLAQVEDELAAAAQHARAERGPEPGQQRRERSVRIGRRLIRPDHVDQLVAAHRPLPADDQAREQLPALAPGESGFDPPPADLRGQQAAELDAGGRACRTHAHRPEGDRSSRSLSNRLATTRARWDGRR